ncbi:hypothetical protein NXY06_01270 [Bacteroides uniformis]|uniref:hypothetical protein n=1 Tax=Bacteroides uniformis TaxID=820 RepID=UPI0021659FB5|nr:hypothetical protein [Bacteroides uniformis]MCS3349754.1 hypothetical protein [Bacteroides uniformis]
MTQIYAKITKQKVNEEMKILSSRIENRYELLKDDAPVYGVEISIKSDLLYKDSDVK